MKIACICVWFLFAFEYRECLKNTREHGRRLKSCCFDYPNCDTSKEDPDFDLTGKSNPLEIDAAAWMVNSKGREELFIFYHNYFFKFVYDSGRNTPTYQLDIEKMNISDKFSGLKKVSWAYSLQNILYIKGDNIQYPYLFDGALTPQTKDSKEVSRSNPWLDSNPSKQMFSPISIAGKGSNGSLLVHWREKSKNGTGTSGSNSFTYEYELHDVQTFATPFKGRFKGRLVSGFGRGTEPITKNSRGMYFTADGRACVFSRDNYGKEFTVEVTTGEELPANQPPCWMSSIFLGCPQSFCYQADVDDIFYRGLHTDAKYWMLFREAYYYEVPVLKDKPLPIKSPTVSEVKYMSSQLIFEQLMDNIDAAFNFKEENKWITVIIKSSMVKYYENDELMNTDSDRVNVVFDGLSGKDQNIRIDTTVYDDKENLLYIFFGAHYSTYERDKEKGLNRWKVKEDKKSLNNFRGIPPFIDGSFDNGDKIYLLKGSYYFTKEKGVSPSSAVYSFEPSIAEKSSDTGIFHLEGCPPKTKDLQLRSRYLRFKPEKYEAPAEENLEEKKPKWNPITIALIGTIAFVVFALLLGAFLLLQKHRKRKAKKAKGKKGKKGKK